MKIRTGFVSNSSTSSFCIFGAEIDESELRKLAEKMNENVTEGEEEDDFDFDPYDLAESLEGLEYENIMGECHYLGRSWSSIGDDETGKQFKESVQSKLKELFGRDVECGTHEEAWRDG